MFIAGICCTCASPARRSMSRLRPAQQHGLHVGSRTERNADPALPRRPDHRRRRRREIHAAKPTRVATSTAVDLQSKAVLVDAPKQTAQGRFRVITPQAIAAVRGTKWAVDVQEPDVGSGAAGPGRGAAAQRWRGQVVLGPGDGVDVEPRQQRAADGQALGAAAHRRAAGAARTMIGDVRVTDREFQTMVALLLSALWAWPARAMRHWQRRRSVSRSRRRRIDRSAPARRAEKGRRPISSPSSRSTTRRSAKKGGYPLPARRTRRASSKRSPA